MIRIDNDLLDGIRRHAELTYPHECCGALIGSVVDDAKHVRRIAPIDNRRAGESARRRFLITPDDYRVLEKQVRTSHMDILGFYHSHPDHPARPSAYDTSHAMPWFSYVIVSVEDGAATRLTSWVLENDRSRFTSEPMDEGVTP